MPPLDPPSYSLFETVSGSKHRIDILCELKEDRFGIRDLSDRLSVPRTTLRHNLNQLMDEGLVRTTLDNEYELTPLGDGVIDGLEAFDRHVQTARSLEPLLTCLSPDQISIDIQYLADAQTTIACRTDPFKPVNRLATLISQGRTVKGYLPTCPLFATAGDLIARSRHTSIELVLPAPVIDELSERETYLFEEAQSASDVTIVPADDQLPYGVLVVDDTAVILGYDENDKPHVLVESQNEECRNWAIRQFEGIATKSPLETVSTG